MKLHKFLSTSSRSNLPLIIFTRINPSLYTSFINSLPMGMILYQDNAYFYDWKWCLNLATFKPLIDSKTFFFNPLFGTAWAHIAKVNPIINSSKLSFQLCLNNFILLTFFTYYFMQYLSVCLGNSCLPSTTWISSFIIGLSSLII